MQYHLRVPHRTIVAWIIAPLWVPVSVAIFTASEVFPYPEQRSWVVISTVLAAMIAYLGVTVIGLPALSVLRARNLTGPWSAATLGLVGGALMWTVFGLFFGLFLGEGLSGPGYLLGGTIEENLRGMIGPLVLGTLVGLTFWMIARPDQIMHSGSSA